MKRLIFLLLICSVVFGCGRIIQAQRAQNYLKNNSSTPVIAMAIQNSELRIGMTREEVIASWGPPRKSNISQGSWGVSEQWIYRSYSRRYPNTKYVYFRNGIMTSIQH